MLFNYIAKLHKNCVNTQKMCENLHIFCVKNY
nr:MAG TPA: hypothetical protein [Caudoviricetes sp.]